MLTEDDVRRIALSMPESGEEPHFESASFCVNKKIFCTLAKGADRATIKLSSEDQHNLIAHDPGILSPISGYWGKKGWTEVKFTGLGEDQLKTLMRLAWAAVAPKRLSRSA
ncbi:MAG: MmcQ/YjbR family DNA-binding protein [Alphaproteobacteria bacterium]